MPRGLNQLGNTCYLNSLLQVCLRCVVFHVSSPLLQYFYTIKDLRETIAPLAMTDAKSLDDKKFTDEDLRRHRVGGRLVTRREIMRSKKCKSVGLSSVVSRSADLSPAVVALLADLFWNMKMCENPAVTPAIELAKLALVTSQDEEEDEVEADKAGTDSSNDTDATLVDDMAVSALPAFDHTSSPLQSPKSPTGSVLGKRPRDADSAMDLDVQSQTLSMSPGSSPPATESVASSKGQEASSFIEEAIASSSSSSVATAKRPAEDADVEMKDESQVAKVPPPLPPRRARQTDDSVMMFGRWLCACGCSLRSDDGADGVCCFLFAGRQHDVSECMDNCMFQIETALLDFQGMATSDDDKTSPVKRCATPYRTCIRECAC